jgi:hypothetical protein
MKNFSMIWKKLWIHFHLKTKCKICPKKRRKLRDIHGVGECFWFHHWSKGNFDVPMWPGFKNWFRVSFLNKKLEESDLYKKPK